MKKNKHVQHQTEPTKKKFRFLKTVGKILLGILVLMFLLVLFIRSPWGQGIIVDKVVTYISDKTHTKVTLERLFLTFDGNLQMDGLYLEDKTKDTLLYSKSLEADIPLWALIRGQGLGVEALNWEGVRANIIRKDSLSGYNFQFLLDAFATTEPPTVATDTTTAPLKIVLGSLNFNNLDIVFKDDVAGIDSRFKVGTLQIDMKHTDVERMAFEATELTLLDSNIKYIQQPVPEDPQAETAPLPVISVEQLTLANVVADYQSLGDRIAADLDIQDLYAEIPLVDLANNTFDINTFSLKNSSIVLHTETETNAVTETVVEVTQDIKQDIQTFEWPELRMAIGSIDFQNNDFSYFVASAEAKEGRFNPNAIVLTDLDLKADRIHLKDQTANLQIAHSSFKEISGFDLKTLHLNFNATDRVLKITDLRTDLNNNRLQADLRLEYPQLSALIEAPEQSKIAVHIPTFQVSLKDAFLIQPSLKKNEYLNALSKRLLTGNLRVSGYVSDIQIASMKTTWGTTDFSAHGTIQNITDPDALSFHIPRFAAITKRSDMVRFIDEKDLGVTLPEDMALAGTVKGNLNDLSTNATLTTSQGLATVEGRFMKGNTMEFDAEIAIADYQLNELLQNEQLGTLNLTLKADGKGQTINDLDATMEAVVTNFTLNGYDIQDLKLNGDFKKGHGTITSNYKDHNLDMAMHATVQLDSVAPEANVELDVKGADLKALGLTQRDVKTGMKLYVDFKGNASNYDLAAIVDDGVVVHNQKTYLMGDLTALAHIRTDTTSVSIKNKLVDLVLQSNTDPKTFSQSLQRHVLGYFYHDGQILDSIHDPVNLKMRGNIVQAPILNEVFLVHVEAMDTVKIAVDFHEKERQLKADITAPHINYRDYILDSLAFSMDTDQDRFVFDLGFNHIKAGPFDIPKTTLTGQQANNEMSLGFIAHHGGEKMIQILGKITGQSDRLRFHVSPSELILNKTPWQTPETNEVIYTKNKLAFTDFRFSKDDQAIEITDQLPTITKDHIALDFNGFKLSEFLSYLNPENTLATGNLNGNFILEAPFENTGIVADMDIRQFALMDVALGTLSLDANALGGNSYDFNAAMKGGDIDLDLHGDYKAHAAGGHFDVDLDINRFNMTALTGFSQGEITDTGGSFSGNFQLSGTTTAPIYEGELHFEDADFKVRRFNTAFTLENEILKMDNDGLSMENFTIRDENQNTLVASGSIGTASFINPTFDLKINATNFQVLNATEEDNDWLYGNATFDAVANITGDLRIPIITTNITVGGNTDITYVLPSATVNIEERDGVVVFVNRDNPDAILTRTEAQTSTLKGFDISALMHIGKEAAVTIVIDEETGDNFKASGEGDFNFNMAPNGNMNLSGMYEVQDGHYELNLYSLVNRRFDIVSGSRVTWSGDPFDAKLDVKALYKVKTSASSLMAPVYSGDDLALAGRFRQVLPFYVYLNIDGQLMAPKINFNLDMPEEEQGAIGGQVYGRVQQLNQQEDELNRQVFSLLVLNRFYPDPGSDGSSGGVASLARDNLNDAVADQLNIVSDKLLGNSGFDLNFGLDSYTDYQGTAPTERTQLDIAAQKKLLDDRLIVSVGSEVDVQGSSPNDEEAPIIGNVSIEYLLTENGRYRLKGFRRNEFENVIDGQTIVSGIALIFTQEFNKFDELWDAMFHAQTQEEKAEKAKLEAAKKAQKAKEKATDRSLQQKTD